MDVSILIIWKSPFLVLGVSGGCFHFYCIFHRNFCKQTLWTLIRHHILWHLNWVCNVCKHQNGYPVYKGLRCIVHLHVFQYFLKGNNFCDFLFASLDDQTLPKMGQLLKERICSHRSKFLPLKVDPFWEGHCGSIWHLKSLIFHLSICPQCKICF